MRINSSFDVTEVAGEHVILLQSDNLLDTTKLLSLNASSLYLWNHLKGKDFELDHVVSALQQAYTIPQEQAQQDAVAWITVLKNYQLILN